MLLGFEITGFGFAAEATVVAGAALGATTVGFLTIFLGTAAGNVALTGDLILLLSARGADVGAIFFTTLFVTFGLFPTGNRGFGFARILISESLKKYTRKNIKSR